MAFTATLRHERFTFADLRELLAKANEEKSGDALAGIAAHSERERVAAKMALADVYLTDIAANPLIDDDVTRAIHDSLPSKPPAMTVGEFRGLLLRCERDL